MSEPQFEYPIVLSLSGRRALVVGGGRVALRKARALADAGARVRVVSPEFLPQFREDGRFDLLAEPYEARHLKGARIVVAATDDEAVNRRVADDARASGVLVNVVDRPALCDFIVPAQVRRGLLQIAISTGGAAPALARRLRERLQNEFGPEYETYLAVVRGVRQELLARDLPPDQRRRLFERLAEDDVLAAAKEGPERLREAIKTAIKAMLSGDPRA